MRHSHSLWFLLATTLGAFTLNCGGDETGLPGSASDTGATGGAAGRPSVATSGAGGTAPGAVGVAGHASGAGGAGASAGGGAANSAANGGATAISGTTSFGGVASGVAAGAGGQPALGAGAPATAGLGGVAGAASAGTSSTAGTGQAGAGAGASGSAGTGTTGPCGAVTGATFAQVETIIAKSCGTTECHPNNMGMHTNLHNTDGKLHSRLLGNAPVSVKPECQNRPLVVPCSPETSFVIQKLTNEEDANGCGARMPFECPEKRECLPPADIETIRSWIAAGALP
jgi:hypothetical protein